MILQTSQAGIDEIVTEEDSGAAYYTRHYESFDFPGGASGPTIGIGFDCGYSTAAQIKQAWTGIVSDETVTEIILAAGIKGQSAAAFCRSHHIVVTWDQAMAEFDNRELPEWEAKCRKALPNYNLLPGDCAGAIDSLTYNRGDGGYNLLGDRYREMRMIKIYMTGKQFHLIPAQYMSMRRLWPEGGDLWRRREHEAALFQHGLQTWGNA